MSILIKDNVVYKECLRWLSDNKPKSTYAIAYVSSDGGVITGEYQHFNVRNNCYQKRKQRERKASLRGNYLRVSLNDKSYSVHRLVAVAWIPNPSRKSQVNHINGNKLDNCVENLEWATASENQRHISDSLNKRCCEKHPHAKNKIKTIRQIKQMLSLGIKNHQICSVLNVNKYLVSDVKKGRTWRNESSF
ncbi:HNH endonuclease [Xenorhabdus sp. XENO-10]|uniref:HNH endonuclease n=1 Tax=Xenorhabdus yunnanensis TaxID=3025878 RepID=A0ABT5LJY1_9GAMM|nr:HNH endonuclease [Xenorhabdus yunnanensis]MDC9591427.1 HNH endonuclease [Xenorhabdus yunnanensis]